MHVAVKSGLSLAVIAGKAALAMQFPGPAAPAAEAPAPAVPVVTAPVQQHDVPIILGGLGTVQALNTAVIHSQATGLLQTVDFVEGQEVHRGDVLAQIDARPYQARLEQAQAQLSRDQAQLSCDQAQLANIEVNLNRNVPRLNKGFATDQQVTSARSSRNCRARSRPTRPPSTTRRPNSATPRSRRHSTASP